MQSLEGIVINGGIVLQPPQELPEGSRVQVTVLDTPTLAQWLTEFAEEGREHRRIHGGRTKEEIDADLDAMRREDAEHDDELDRLHQWSMENSKFRRPS
jgi:hypothetical protein